MFFYYSNTYGWVKVTPSFSGSEYFKTGVNFYLQIYCMPEQQEVTYVYDLIYYHFTSGNWTMNTMLRLLPWLSGCRCRGFCTT